MSATDAFTSAPGSFEDVAARVEEIGMVDEATAFDDPAAKAAPPVMRPEHGD